MQVDEKAKTRKYWSCSAWRRTGRSRRRRRRKTYGFTWPTAMLFRKGSFEICKYESHAIKRYFPQPLFRRTPWVVARDMVTHTHRHTHTHTHSLAHTHALTHTLAHIHSHTHSHIHSHSLSLTHTLTHTHTYIQVSKHRNKFKISFETSAIDNTWVISARRQVRVPRDIKCYPERSIRGTKCGEHSHGTSILK
jgi:hypothetical protein